LTNSIKNPGAEAEETVAGAAAGPLTSFKGCDDEDDEAADDEDDDDEDDDDGSSGLESDRLGFFWKFTWINNLRCFTAPSSTFEPSFPTALRALSRRTFLSSSVNLKASRAFENHPVVSPLSG
jgi:hypothetical protein